MNALIIVDVQKGYINGRDAVEDALGAVMAIKTVLKSWKGYVVQTIDVPAPAISYSDQVKEWSPPTKLEGHTIPLFQVETLYKTTLPNRDGYSAFHAIDRAHRPLLEILREKEVDNLLVCGLSLDYCVKATAIDAVDAGFTTVVHLNLTRPAWPSLGLQAILDLEMKGVTVLPYRASLGAEKL